MAIANAVTLAEVFELHARGELDQAAAGYRALIAARPHDVMLYGNLAALELSRGRNEEAIELLSQALDIDPTQRTSTVLLGDLLLAGNRHDDAGKVYRRAIAADPDFADAHLGLGLALRAQGEIAPAIAAFQTAVARAPDNHLAWFNLGLAYGSLRDLDAALPGLRRAAELAPDTARYQTVLGGTLFNNRHVGEAIAAFERAACLAPDDHDAVLGYGIALLDDSKLGEGHAPAKLDRAIEVLRRAAKINPGHVEGQKHLGRALLARHWAKDAAAAFRDALALKPDDAQALQGLGTALYAQDDFDGAIAALQDAIALKPDYADAHLALGVALFRAGRLTEATEAFRRTITLAPTRRQGYDDLIFALAFGQQGSPAEILEIGRAFERHCAIKATPVAPRNIPRGRQLRVGILSAEVGRHAVAYFLMPFLRHYDRSRLTIKLYPTLLRQDEVRTEMLGLVDGSCDLFLFDDAEAHKWLVADDLDILIDTSSYTEGGRLNLLTARCAQIQCHYIGFTATTGISTMDYFIGDEEIAPPAFAPHFSETIWRLPIPWMAYEAPRDIPTPEQLSGSDEIVLGSFNNLTKVRAVTLDLWANLLNAIPTARLVLKDRLAAHGTTRARILDNLTAKGVDPHRVEFIAYVESWADHMRLYNRLDVALDTFPFNSCTTAYDALSMGTPVVAMRGAWCSGRATSSILKGIGRAEWIAETAADYLNAVRALVADKARLRDLKRTLRDDMLNGPLCDGPALARALENALAAMADNHNAKFGSS